HLRAAGWPRAALSALNRSRVNSADFISDLGVPRFMNGFPLLSTLTFLPLSGAILVIGLDSAQRRMARHLALGVSLLSLGLTVILWRQFDGSKGELQFPETHSWIPSLGVQYHLGVDGLGLLMILLSAIVVPMAMLASWKIEDRVPLYFGLMLFLE